MRLTIDEVARRLDLPVRTIERWVRQGRIPAHRWGDEVHFDERELAAWADSHSLSLAATRQPPQRRPETTPVELVETMRRGDVHYGVGGHDVESVLAAAVARIPLPDEHRDLVLERLLQREELSSTGIGGGVAVPHPRNPLSDIVPAPMISTCFLERAVDFGAVDGQPVQILFVLLAPTTKAHLKLLARLAFCLRDRTFLQLLQEAPERDRFFAEVNRCSGGIAES